LTDAKFDRYDFGGQKFDQQICPMIFLEISETLTLDSNDEDYGQKNLAEGSFLR
jgi:hypothetical protein